MDKLGGMGDIQQYLQGINFPAQKEEVASGAESNGAPQGVVDKIKERRDGTVQRPTGRHEGGAGLTTGSLCSGVSRSERR